MNLSASGHLMARIALGNERQSQKHQQHGKKLLDKASPLRFHWQ